MGKHAIRRKIVGRVHEVGSGGGSFARAADAALGVGNNSVIEIDESGRDQRLERQNDRSCIAARIGDQLRAGDLLAMKLRHAIDGLRLRGRGQFGAFVVEGIYGAIGWLGQPPCAAQIDDAQPALERFRDPLARLLMRRSEKQHVDAALEPAVPMRMAPASDWRRRRCLLVADESPSAERRRAQDPCHPRARQRPAACLQTGMMQQQPRQLGAGIAGDSHDRGLYGLRHDCQHRP